ncbi:reverse transcriptase domain-containing protein, partial [Tanacetum coccineum]
DDARYDRALLRARVNRLDSDRPFHRRTALLIEEEARLSRAAWARRPEETDSDFRAAESRLSEAEAVSRDPKDSEEPQAQMTAMLQETQDLQGSCRARATKEAVQFRNGVRAVATSRLLCTKPTKCYEYISANMALENGTKRKAHKNYEVKAAVPGATPQPVLHNAPTRITDPTPPATFGHTCSQTAGHDRRGCHCCVAHVPLIRMAMIAIPRELGTEGVVSLTQWFERMETVFRISNCTVENQVKFATCTLMGTALTWWNSHVRTVSHDVAYAMTWTDLKKKMTTKYCPRNEIKKIKAEL